MATQRWNIDSAHSGIHFTVRHMVIAKVRGGFGRFQGTVDFDPADPASAQIAVSIDAASVDTREPKRDEHLRSADFFDVATYPTLEFASTGVVKVGDDSYRVAGNLTLHGVTRPVVLEAEYLGLGQDPWGQTRVAFQAKTTLNRKEFGLGWNQVLETGGVLVGDKVEIALDVQAVAAQAQARAA
jgi:polyisoprenoid-binding protein YceI